MLRLPAGLPDPLVGVRPGLDRRLHLVADQLAGRPGCRGPAAPFRGGRSSRAASPRRRSGAGRRRRCRSAPARAPPYPSRWSSVFSVEVALVADPVHDLEVGVVLADVDDEAHEVARLVVEAERVHGPEAEGRVADPAEAVVPVAFAPGCLRQRGGRGGDDRPGRGVGQALEDEGRALQVDPPGVVGEAAVAQPFAPELFGRVDPLQRLGGAAGAAELAVAPGQRAEGGLGLRAGSACPGRRLRRRASAPGRWSAAARSRRRRRRALRRARRRSNSRPRRP